MMINEEFRAFVENELLTGLEINPEQFWRDLQSIIEDLSLENRALLEVRDEFQAQIDCFYENSRETFQSIEQSRQFLEQIGYIVPVGEKFEIETRNVDPEIASIAGPQLVVPVNNARFALNAANARWGSLYDALYGTDVISTKDGKSATGAYNSLRGDAVIEYGARFLDKSVPLAQGSHLQVISYSIPPGTNPARLQVVLADGTETSLADSDQLTGWSDKGGKLKFLLQHNGLHIELNIDPDNPVGKQSASGLCDIELESAITTIQDCEDSVTAVDASDKIGVYRNWLGLMQGNLQVTFVKGGRQVTRQMNPDRQYNGLDGSTFTLAGRSLMLVRNVGHLMTSDAILDTAGEPVFEGILDAVITTACALYDLRGLSLHSNSRTGSIYIVKPKMHGPQEVAFTDKLFSRVEVMFGLARSTIKVGVMDEERRTTVNLGECIRAVKDRLVFINTGFLDRTGDEIHTCMKAGPVLPKNQIKDAAWIKAYEDWNVDIGIRCGLPGRAQIGKGMWAMPDEMKAMVESKSAHLKAGANCAWVPSPTAATLHAMHYHEINVFQRQKALASRPIASLEDILTPPMCDVSTLDAGMIQLELDNNAQGILGYVVRWIDQGIGCSKVPDINDTGLMEDRATLRIASQHISNWLQHEICSEQQVIETFRRMAGVVDQQNAHDPAYINMVPDFEGSVAFQAACALALKGHEQPNGYTEPLLHEYRRTKKLELAKR
ncbi:MAG: malate synthase [Lysobacterales bacterium]|jgi:malate synthase